MNGTYFGEAARERIVLEDLEIEGWKRNSFTHITFWLKTVLMYDAYFRGAGVEATFRADLVVRSERNKCPEHTALLKINQSQLKILTFLNVWNLQLDKLV